MDDGSMVAAATTQDRVAAAEAAVREEFTRLHPDDQQMVRDVIDQHPDLTLATALAHLKEAGM